MGASTAGLGTSTAGLEGGEGAIGFCVEEGGENLNLSPMMNLVSVSGVISFESR